MSLQEGIFRPVCAFESEDINILFFGNNDWYSKNVEMRIYAVVLTKFI